jgi:hypothetical protein
MMSRDNPMMDDSEEESSSENKQMPLFELKAILDANIHNSMGYLSGDLTSQREKALSYYLGEPFGDEVEGRSKIVSTDVADVIEWIMPSLMRTFASNEEAVRFDPMGAEDIDAAEQETDYVNHVFYKDNPGFLILYIFLKVGILQKNSYVKVFWEETNHETREAYQKITDDELLLLLQDTTNETLEPVQHTEYSVTQQTEQGPVEQRLHDIVFKRTNTKGQVKIINAAPENVGVAKNWYSVDLKDCPFSYHKDTKTASELLEMGIDQSIIDKLQSADEAMTGEEISRNNLKDEANKYTQTSSLDKSMRLITVYECYIKVDFDGDGIAELRKILKAGNEILINEEIDGNPLISFTPIILPHKHYGLSVADQIMDLQLIKSTIWRQMLDNMYLINNSRTAINKNMVNLDDLLTSRPGGIVRCDGDPNAVLAPIVTQPLSPTSYQMIEYIDRVREGRTGVSQTSMGLNDNLLSNNKGDQTVARVMTAAEQRIELIARVAAETAIKSLFLKIHELLLKHQDKERVIRLRNKWVPVNPSEWRARSDMTVNVGLGNGERQALVQSMMAMLNTQKDVVEHGGDGILVGPQNIYRTVIDTFKYAGIKNPEVYWTDPMSQEAQQAVQLKQQSQQEAKQSDPGVLLAQVESQKNQITAQKNDLEHQRKMLELSQKERAMQEDMNQKIADITKKFETQLNDQAIKLTELELKYSHNVPGSLV